MSRQTLLDYLLCKTDSYENADNIGLTRGGGDFQALYSPVCERPMWHTGYDVFGVHWTQADPATHYTNGQNPIITDIEAWESQVRFPKVDRFNWDYVKDQAGKLDRENKVIVTTLALGPFERTTTLSSFEDALVNCISDPEDYSDLIGAIVDYKIEIVKRICDYGHPDIINFHDDWGTSNNTFLRPEMWRQVIKPHTQRLYDAARERGALVGQHSCGCIGALIPDMIEMGCTIWEGNGYCNDIAGISKEYGNKLRIFAPPIKKEDKPSSNKTFPDISSVALCYHPYEEVPAFLYE